MPQHKAKTKHGRPPPYAKRPRRSAKPSSTDTRYDLYGLHAVTAALANPARLKHGLYLTANARLRLDDMLGEPLDRLAQAANPPFTIHDTDSRTLNRRLGDDAVHQGCVLDCDALDDSAAAIPLNAQRLLVLDQITDPHNVGAILRTAAAFGIDAVITTARHAPGETGVLAKAASGALDIVPLVRVTNLGDMLEGLGQSGVFRLGLDSEGDSEISATAIPLPYALVLGSEGKGLRQRTRGLCDAIARITLPGAIQSLNVSNAAALALYATRLVEGGSEN